MQIHIYTYTFIYIYIHIYVLLFISDELVLHKSDFSPLPRFYDSNNEER